MRRGRKQALLALATAGVLFGSGAADVRADVATDRAAAILVFPNIIAQRYVYQATSTSPPSTIFVDQGGDTIIQISNLSNQTTYLKCFYVDATNLCSTSGFVCDPVYGGCPEPEERCLPSWVETDFRVILTPEQPVAWRLSAGLDREHLPLDGTLRQGIGGAGNAGTAVPPIELHPIFLGEEPPPEVSLVELSYFEGELKCIVVDAQGRAVPRNVVKGEATIEGVLTEKVEELVPDVFQPSSVTAKMPMPVPMPMAMHGMLDEVSAAQGTPGMVQEPFVDKYNAIGIQAIEADANGDRVLELGGDANEYNGCPNVLVMDHFFDGAIDPISGYSIDSGLVLVPCEQNFRRQEAARVSTQFLVFNEFEQRFSTSAPVDCYFRKDLSNIDTPDKTRSIFSAYVAGTLTGQTRIRGVDGGLLGVVEEFHGGPAAFDLHHQGIRTDADRIVLP